MTADNNNDPTSNNLISDSALFPTDTTTAKIADRSGENKLPAPSDIDMAANTAAADIRDGGGYMELLEERPVVSKERLDVGKVTVTKHTRSKTINVPIELVEEYITVQTDYNDAERQDLLSGNYDDKDILRHVEPSLDSKAVVTVNGKQVEIGDAPIEIILSRQVATITKDTYAIQEVAVSKTTHTHTDNIQVELRHEELDVKEEGFLEHEGSHITKK